MHEISNIFKNNTKKVSDTCINRDVFFIYFSFNKEIRKIQKMNKLISLILLIASVIVLANAKRTKVDLLNHDDLDTHWNTFKSKSGKKFSSSSHERHRLK